MLFVHCRNPAVWIQVFLRINEAQGANKSTVINKINALRLNVWSKRYHSQLIFDWQWVDRSKGSGTTQLIKDVFIPAGSLFQVCFNSSQRNLSHMCEHGDIIESDKKLVFKENVLLWAISMCLFSFLCRLGSAESLLLITVNVSVHAHRHGFEFLRHFLETREALSFISVCLHYII